MDAATNDVVRGLEDQWFLREMVTLKGPQDGQAKAQITAENARDAVGGPSDGVVARSRFKGAIGRVFKMNTMKVETKDEKKHRLEREQEEKKQEKSLKRGFSFKKSSKTLVPDSGHNKRHRLPTEMAEMAAAAAALHETQAPYDGYGERHIDLHCAAVAAEVELLHEMSESLRTCGLNMTALWRLEQATQRAVCLLRDCETARRKATALQRSEEKLRNEKGASAKDKKYLWEKKLAEERLAKDAEEAKQRQEEFDEHARQQREQSLRQGVRTLKGGWLWGVGWVGLGQYCDMLEQFTQVEDEEEKAERLQKEAMQREVDEKRQKRQEALAILAAAAGGASNSGTAVAQAEAKNKETAERSQMRKQLELTLNGNEPGAGGGASGVAAVPFGDSVASKKRKFGPGGPNMYPSVWRRLRFKRPPKAMCKNSGIALLMSTRQQRVQQVESLRKLDIVLAKGRVSLDPWGEEAQEIERQKAIARKEKEERAALIANMAQSSAAQAQSSQQAMLMKARERQLNMLNKRKGGEALTKRKEWRSQGKEAVRNSKIYWAEARVERAELRLATCQFAQAMILGQRLDRWADYAARSSSNPRRSAKSGALALFEQVKARRARVLGPHHELTDEAAKWVRQGKNQLKHGDSKKKKARQDALTKLLGSGGI
jgi:hypothetical protein